MILAVPSNNPINKGLLPYQLPPEAIGTPAQNAVPPVPMHPFREEAFILMKSGNDTRARGDALCALGGFSPKVAMEFDQQMISYLVGCSGAGITFVSSFLVSRISPNPGICYYRLPEPESRRSVQIFWKRDRYVTRAMRAFLETASR